MSYQFFDLKFGELGVDKWCPGPDLNLWVKYLYISEAYVRLLL
ncbi:hypothetical protein ALT721_800093 [Alteromonas alvinellae]